MRRLALEHGAHGRRGQRRLRATAAPARPISRTPSSTACEQPNTFDQLYPLDVPIKDKIEAVATRVYGASDVTLRRGGGAQDRAVHRATGSTRCRSAWPRRRCRCRPTRRVLGAPTDFTLEVRDIRAYTGAGWLVPLCGDIMQMPGLGASPGRAQDRPASRRDASSGSSRRRRRHACSPTPDPRSTRSPTNGSARSSTRWPAASRCRRPARRSRSRMAMSAALLEKAASAPREGVPVDAAAEARAGRLRRDALRARRRGRRRLPARRRGEVRGRRRAHAQRAAPGRRAAARHGGDRAQARADREVDPRRRAAQPAGRGARRRRTWPAPAAIAAADLVRIDIGSEDDERSQRAALLAGDAQALAQALATRPLRG